MKFNALARIERNARRAGEILGVLANYGLADWVKGWIFEAYLGWRLLRAIIKSGDIISKK